MESLNDTEWDVVISGTGLKQSLLALSLSRSKLKVLHLDRNDYYGGNEAAFSLTEAEEWAAQHNTFSNTTFANAVIHKHNEDKLGSSRRYSIALAPQLIYARSKLLDSLVSSKVHDQIDVLAVGSWSVLVKDGERFKLLKVPNGREDIFRDSTFDLKEKRALVKFIRFIGDADAQGEARENDSRPMTQYLDEKFGLPKTSHAAILALTMSAMPAKDVTIKEALPSVTRHLQSIGRFGAFAALAPKWGGLAEIAQVACRAQAVNGGTYVLDCGIDKIDAQNEQLVIKLSRGDTVKAKTLVGNDLLQPSTNSQIYSRGVFIISASLDLFPLTAEGGTKSAGAVISVPGATAEEPPVQILAHSSDTGECPNGQCILYASVASDKEHGFTRLQSAVHDLVRTLDAAASVIWSMLYEQRQNTYPSADGNIVPMDDLEPAFTINDSEVEGIQQAWKRIIGDDEEAFLEFEARDGADNDDDSDG